MRWWLVAVVLAAGTAIAVPFLVPVAHFIPEIARIASGSLGQPVTITDLKVHVLPTPRLVAEGVRIGKKGEVVIGELEIVPELLSLFSGPRAIRLLRAEKVELTEAALSIPDRMPKGGEPVPMRRLVLRDVRLQHSALKLPPFNVDAQLGSGLGVGTARIDTSDGALKLLVEPDGAGRTIVKLEGSRWRLPLAAAPLLFDSLKADGILTGKRLELSNIEGRQYGGTLQGSARVGWAKSWQVSGTAVLAGVDLAAAQKALGRDPRLAGKLGANAKFAATAKSPDQLAGALAVDGPFNVADGIYHGVDFAKVGDLIGDKGAGGTTRFDELRGVLQLRGKRMRINNLCLKSSALHAAGYVEVAPDQSLTGRLDVAVAKTGGFVGVPVALSGTRQDPVVRPTAGYTIGAVVGTVLLPGIGTALGASAGGAVEGKAGDCK
ncbi:MAG: AsmA-like C-terminal region-containing protein [Bradyrhizobium sp.]